MMIAGGYTAPVAVRVFDSSFGVSGTGGGSSGLNPSSRISPVLRTAV
jgi:hypothetical protein